MKVETVRRKVVDEKPEKDRVYGSQEEMLEKANGKKLILQKISWRNHVRIGWKQKEINQKKQHRKRNIIMKRRRL